MKERLKMLRKSLGLTQGAFGKKIGMSDTSISHMEAGRTPINEQNFRLICLTFGIREEWFRTGEGKMIDEEGEELIRVSYRLPPDIIKRLQESAIANRRSINDEVIVLLEKALVGYNANELKEHLDKRLDRLESRILPET